MTNKKRITVSGNRPRANLGALLPSIISAAGSVASTVASTAIQNDGNRKLEERRNRLQEYQNALREATGMSSQLKGTLATNQDYNTQYNTEYKLGGRRSIKGNRPKAFVGTAIAVGASLASSIIGSLLSNSAKKRAAERQRRVENYNNTVQEASQLSQALTGTEEVNNDYQRQFNSQAKLGSRRKLREQPVITDGGDAVKVGNGTFLLRGSSHEDINESGNTGIGISVGNKEIEAEGGEIAQIKKNQLRIFSGAPILNGISPVEAILYGANKDEVFAAQERFKKIAGLNDDGTFNNSSPVKVMHYGRPKHRVGGMYNFSRRRLFNTSPFGSYDDPPIDFRPGSIFDPSRSVTMDEVVVTPPKKVVQPQPQPATIPSQTINTTGNKSGMAIRTGDWIGLGGDILGSIATGIINSKGANSIHLPERPGFLQAAKLKTTYNVAPQEEEVNRARNRAFGDIDAGTASSVAALNRRNLLNTKATDDIDKLYAQKENVETELINKDALNQQEVAAQNLKIQSDWANKVADIQNAKDNAKTQAKVMSLQGFGRAVSNFVGQASQRYEDIQGMRYALAASENGTAYRMMNSGVDLDQDTIMGIFGNAYNQNLTDPGTFEVINGEDPTVTAERRKAYDRKVLNYKQNKEILNSAYGKLGNTYRRRLRDMGVMQTSW
mgnify:FL=1|jgi:hypothetical protein